MLKTTSQWAERTQLDYTPSDMELPQTAALLVWGLLVTARTGAIPAPAPDPDPVPKHHFKPDVGEHSLHVSKNGQVIGHVVHAGPAGRGYLVRTAGPLGNIGTFTHIGPGGSYSHIQSHATPLLHGGVLHVKHKPHLRERSLDEPEDYPEEQRFPDPEPAPEYHQGTPSYIPYNLPGQPAPEYHQGTPSYIPYNPPDQQPLYTYYTQPITVTPYVWPPNYVPYDLPNPITYEPQNTMTSYTPNKRMAAFEPQTYLMQNRASYSPLTRRPQNPLLVYGQYKPSRPFGSQKPLTPYLPQIPLPAYGQYKPVRPFGPQKPSIPYLPQISLPAYGQYKPFGQQKPLTPYLPQIPLPAYGQYKPVSPFGSQKPLVPYLPQSSLPAYGQYKPVRPYGPQKPLLPYLPQVHLPPYGQYRPPLPLRPRTVVFSNARQNIVQPENQNMFPEFQPRRLLYRRESSNHEVLDPLEIPVESGSSAEERHGYLRTPRLLIPHIPLLPLIPLPHLPLLPLPKLIPHLPLLHLHPHLGHLRAPHHRQKRYLAENFEPKRNPDYKPAQLVLQNEGDTKETNWDVTTKKTRGNRRRSRNSEVIKRLSGENTDDDDVVKDEENSDEKQVIEEEEEEEEEVGSVLEKQRKKVREELKHILKVIEKQKNRARSGLKLSCQQSADDANGILDEVESRADDPKFNETVGIVQKPAGKANDNSSGNLENTDVKKDPKIKDILDKVENVTGQAKNHSTVNLGNKEIKEIEEKVQNRTGEASDNSTADLENKEIKEDPKINEIVEKVQKLTGQAGVHPDTNLENTDIKEDTTEKTFQHFTSPTTENPHEEQHFPNLSPPPHPTPPQIVHHGVNYAPIPNYPYQHFVPVQQQSYEHPPPPNYAQYPYGNPQLVFIPPHNNHDGYDYGYPPPNHFGVQYRRNAYVPSSPAQEHSYEYNVPPTQEYYHGSSPHSLKTGPPIVYTLSRPLFVPYTGGDYLDAPTSSMPYDCPDPNDRQFVDADTMNGNLPRFRSAEGETDSELLISLPRNDAYDEVGPMSYPLQDNPYQEQDGDYQNYVEQYPQYHVPNYVGPVQGSQYVSQGKPSYVMTNPPVSQTPYPDNDKPGEKPSRPDHQTVDILQELHKTYQDNLASINKLTTERLNFLRDMLLPKNPLSSLTSLLDATKHPGSQGGADTSHSHNVEQHKGLNGYNSHEFEYEGRDYGYGHPPWTGGAAATVSYPTGGYETPGVTDLGGLHRVVGGPYHQVHKDKGYEVKEVALDGDVYGGAQNNYGLDGYRYLTHNK